MAFRLTAETAPHYRDRHEAGRLLARTLKRYRGKANLVVLGLPRGVYPSRMRSLHWSTRRSTFFVVRKLGMPDHPEVAFGAIASGGVQVLSDDVIRWYGISAVVAAVVAHELVEQERHEREYRRGPMTESSVGRTSERLNHYYRARLPGQFDAVIHIDETRAVEPLELWSHDEAAAAETNPSPLQT